MKQIGTTIHQLSFWAFIAIKLAGTSLATWSWWWLLLPPVPCISLLVTAYRL
jgi:hypothetical protein